MSKIEWPVVPPSEARCDPYPVVVVEDDGTFRECSADERAHLEESFHPADGSRPYVKLFFWSVTPDGRLGGFLRRSRLPRGLEPGDPPPRKPWWWFW